jgi:Fe-S-cluster-containing dehydrogenase component
MVNQLPKPALDVGDAKAFDKKRRTSPEAYTVVNRYEAKGKTVFRKQQCMHCNEPCCATVCLVRAFEKTPEGPVLYHPELCMGCRYCVMACPYYALTYDYDNPLTPEVRRCTMCYPRIKEGKNPGCSEACPTGAILFGKRDELLGIARERLRKEPDRYVPQILGEEEFGGTSWLLLAGVDFADLGLAALADAPQTPLPEIGTSYLSVVPLVITLYPGLLMGMRSFAERKDKLAREEKQQALSDAQSRAEAETRDKLAETAKKAERDKQSAITQAVKKALADAAKEKEKTP